MSNSNPIEELASANEVLRFNGDTLNVAAHDLYQAILDTLDYIEECGSQHQPPNLMWIWNRLALALQMDEITWTLWEAGYVSLIRRIRAHSEGEQE